MKFNYFILLDGKYPRLNLSAAGSTRHFAKGSYFNFFYFYLCYKILGMKSVSHYLRSMIFCYK